MSAESKIAERISQIASEIQYIAKHHGDMPLYETIAALGAQIASLKIQLLNLEAEQQKNIRKI